MKVTATLLLVLGLIVAGQGSYNPWTPYECYRNGDILPMGITQKCPTVAVHPGDDVLFINNGPVTGSGGMAPTALRQDMIVRIVELDTVAGATHTVLDVCVPSNQSVRFVVPSIFSLTQVDNYVWEIEGIPSCQGPDVRDAISAATGWTWFEDGSDPLCTPSPTMLQTPCT